MTKIFPTLYLARHGETAWSLSGQHTGLTDLPLTERGERNARNLGPRLAGLAFAKVFTSPLQRATRTYRLPSSTDAAAIDPYPPERNNGDSNGPRTSATDDRHTELRHEQDFRL